MYSNDIGGMYEEPSGWPYYGAASLVVFIIMCLLINTIQNIFHRISPDLRSVSSAQLWITIIPFFGSIWIFYVIYQLANALSEEFKRRKIIEFETSPGLGIGWAFAFFFATAQLTLLIDEALITILLYIVAVVLLIIYWVRIAGFKDKLDHEMIGHSQPFASPQFPFQQQMPPQQQWPPYQPPHFPPQDAPKPEDEWEKWKPKQ